MTAEATGRFDRRASGVREEPRARLPDHRRPARRRRRSRRDRQAGARGRQEDHVRVVQRRRRRAQLATELCHTADRALGAVRPACGTAARALGVRRRENELTSWMPPRSSPARGRRSPSTASFAGLPRRRRRPLRPGPCRRGAPALAIALARERSDRRCSPRSCSDRQRRSAWRRGVPGLITGARDGFVVAAYLGPAVWRGLQRCRVRHQPDCVTHRPPAGREPAASRPRAGGGDGLHARVPRLPDTLVGRVDVCCAGLGWRSLWTLIPLAFAAGISLLLGHLVTVTTLAVVVSRNGGVEPAHGAPDRPASSWPRREA